jgi:error-prone DNA polymerase
MATFKVTDDMAAYKDRLVAGMGAPRLPGEFAEQVFAQFEGSGSYGFPESRAASFAQFAYSSGWMKCHHPAAFTCALLNSQPMRVHAPAQLVLDAREHGVVVREADVTLSDRDSGLEPQQRVTDGLALRLGLRPVSQMQEKEATLLIKAGRTLNGSPFMGVEDLALRA